MASRRQSPRRRTTWFDTRLGEDIASATEANIQLTPDVSAAAVGLEGYTAVRIVLFMSMYSAIPNSASGEMILDFGIGMASQTAFDIGTTGLPNVETSADFPERGWLLRSNRLIMDSLGITFPPVFVTADLRAMRKLENSVMYLQLKNQTIRGTTFNVRVNGWVRLLCLLP